MQRHVSFRDSPPQRLGPQVLSRLMVMAASSLRSFEFDKPVVCGIEGPCHTAGFEIVLATDDAREGPRAFMKKRPPVYKGS